MCARCKTRISRQTLQQDLRDEHQAAVRKSCERWNSFIGGAGKKQAWMRSARPSLSFFPMKAPGIWTRWCETSPTRPGNSDVVGGGDSPWPTWRHRRRQLAPKSRHRHLFDRLARGSGGHSSAVTHRLRFTISSRGVPSTRLDLLAEFTPFLSGCPFNTSEQQQVPVWVPSGLDGDPKMFGGAG